MKSMNIAVYVDAYEPAEIKEKIKEIMREVKKLDTKIEKKKYLKRMGIEPWFPDEFQPPENMDEK